MYYATSVAKRVVMFLCVMLGMRIKCLLLPNFSFRPMGKTKLRLLLALVVYMWERVGELRSKPRVQLSVGWASRTG